MGFCIDLRENLSCRFRFFFFSLPLLPLLPPLSLLGAGRVLVRVVLCFLLAGPGLTEAGPALRMSCFMCSVSSLCLGRPLPPPLLRLLLLLSLSCKHASLVEGLP